MQNLELYKEHLLFQSGDAAEPSARAHSRSRTTLNARRMFRSKKFAANTTCRASRVYKIQHQGLVRTCVPYGICYVATCSNKKNTYIGVRQPMRHSVNMKWAQASCVRTAPEPIFSQCHDLLRDASPRSILRAWEIPECSAK